MNDQRGVSFLESVNLMFDRAASLVPMKLCSKPPSR